MPWATKEARNAYLAGWRAKQGDRLRAYRAEWYRKNVGTGRTWEDELAHRAEKWGGAEEQKARRVASQKRWANENPEKAKEKRERYNARHPGRRAVLYRLNLERNRMLKRVNAARRRARLRDAHGDASAQDILARVAFYGERCWICRAPWEQVDHVIPLAEGGTHWPANLRPICAECNYVKAAKRLDPNTIKEVRRGGSLHLVRQISQSA